MSRDFPVTGLKEILDNLSALGTRIETQAIRSGLTAAAAEVRDEARLRVPKRSGLTAKSIRSGNPRKNQDGTFSISVRADPKAKHAYLAYFIEYGVRSHLIASTGKGEGRVSVRKAKEGKGKVKNGVMKIGNDFVSGIISHPGHAAHPFLRPALDVKAAAAITAFRNKVIAVVEGKTGYDLAASLDEAA